MKRQSPRLAVLALVAVLSIGAALPVAARQLPVEPAPVVRGFQETGDNDSGTSSRDMLIWFSVGVGVFGLVLGVLYLFKKEIGGFPENPDWVAPITILRSKDSPDEGFFGDAPAGHGHDSHH